jgi:DNA-binding transcriptional regulator YdaS (Cro superfamily)
MPDQRTKITAAQFAARLKAVLGDGYEKAFAEAVGVALSTVYRWCSGDVPVPQYAVAIVEFLEALPKAFRPPRWTRE